MGLKSVIKYDIVLFYWLYGLILNCDCCVIIWLLCIGDGYLYLVIGLVLMWFEFEYGEFFFYIVFMVYGLEFLIYVVLKCVFKCFCFCDFISNLMVYVMFFDKFSLFLGYIVVVWLMVIIIVYFYFLFVVLVYIWVILIGLLCILFGVYYFIDVIVGILFGIIIV